MAEDDACQYCKGRILLIRQNDCRVQQGYLEVEVGKGHINKRHERYVPENNVKQEQAGTVIIVPACFCYL